MMAKLANISKNLPNVHCFAIESFVVFFGKKCCQFFLAEIASFWNFRLVVRNDSYRYRCAGAGAGATDTPSLDFRHRYLYRQAVSVILLFAYLLSSFVPSSFRRFGFACFFFFLI